MSWRVAKTLDVLLAQYNRKFPSRSKSYDGSIGDAAHSKTKSEHNPDARGVVRARDYTASSPQGNFLAAAALRTIMARGQKGYVIWNGRIANPDVQGGKWRAYHGASPHDHHVHVSVLSQIDTTAPWLLDGTAAPAPSKPVNPTPPKSGRGSLRGPFPGGHTPYGVGGRDGSNDADKGVIRLIQAAVGVTTDGLYGKGTAAAVGRWQAAHKLAADGVVGPATWAALVRAA